MYSRTQNIIPGASKYPKIKSVFEISINLTPVYEECNIIFGLGTSTSVLIIFLHLYKIIT